MMVSAPLFRDLGGNVKYYSNSFFDGADLALRARASGKRNIVTPQAIVQTNDASLRNGWRLDESLFSDRWDDLMRRGDPYNNPSLLVEVPSYSVVAATTYA
jgi:hypothetical protein